MADSTSPEPLITLHINSATIADWMLLPQMTKTVASQIVEHRASHGAFESIDDLMWLPGVSEGLLDAWRQQLRPGEGPTTKPAPTAMEAPRVHQVASSASDRPVTYDGRRRQSDAVPILGTNADAVAVRRVTRGVTVNVRCMLWFALATFGLGATVVAVHHLQIQRLSDALLVRATKAQDAGKTELAIRLLRQYIALFPKDLDARRRVADTLLEVADSPEGYVAAYVALGEALRLAPEDDEFQKKLADLSMEVGLWNEAATHLAALAERFPDAHDHQERLAECYELQGLHQEAADALSALVKRAPHNWTSYAKLAFVLRFRLKRPRDAEELLDRVVEQNRGSADALRVRASYRLQTGQLARALVDSAMAFELAEDTLEIDLILGELALRMSEASIDAAEIGERLSEHLAKHPNEPRLYTLQARIAAHQHRPEDAESWLRKGLEAIPDNTSLQLQLAILLFDLGRGDASAVEVAQLHGREAERIATYLEARTMAQLQQWRQAAELFDTLRPLVSNQRVFANDVDQWLARCAKQLLDTPSQVAAFRRIIERDPTHSVARLELVSLLASQHKFDEALKRLELVEVTSVETATLVARLTIDRMTRRPAETRDWTMIEKTIERAARLDKHSVDVTLLRARVQELKGEVVAARNILRAACRSHENEVPTWLALAEFELRNGCPQAASQILDDATTACGSKVELALAEIRFCRHQPSEQALQSLTRFAKQIDEWPNEQRRRVVLELASTWQRLGENEFALKLLQAESRRTPNFLPFQLALFDHARSHPDMQMMERALDRVRSIEGPSGPYARCLEAALLIERASGGNRDALEKARALLDELTRERPTWAPAWLTRARLSDLESHREQAVESYLMAANSAELDAPTTTRVAAILASHERFAEADEVIRAFQSAQREPFTQQLGMLAARVALKAGRAERALDIARQMTVLYPSDYVSHLHLGQLLGEMRDANAEASFRLATSLDVKRGDAWIGLVAHLAERREGERAIQVIREVEQAVPAKDRPLILGRCWELLGYHVKADHQYHVALSIQPESAHVLVRVADFLLRTEQPARARPILWKIVEPKFVASKTEREWAQNQLESLLSH